MRRRSGWPRKRMPIISNASRSMNSAPREAMPSVASVTTIWPGAEFMEREAFEMMGIRFLGHPDLRRILLPDDFVGFPMRRDFETDFEYITVKQLVRDTD